MDTKPSEHIILALLRDIDAASAVVADLRTQLAAAASRIAELETTAAFAPEGNQDATAT